MTGEISDLLASYKRQAGQESEKSDFVESRLKVYYYVFDKHSPYAEVRASVPNTDDPALPVETFRVWVIGLGLVAIFASMNQVLPQSCCILISVLFSSLAKYLYRLFGLSGRKLPNWCRFRALLAHSEIQPAQMEFYTELRSVQSERAHAYYMHGQCWHQSSLCSLDFRDTNLEDVFRPTLGTKQVISVLYLIVHAMLGLRTGRYRSKLPGVPRLLHLAPQSLNNCLKPKLAREAKRRAISILGRVIHSISIFSDPRWNLLCVSFVLVFVYELAENVELVLVSCLELWKISIGQLGLLRRIRSLP